jgi:RNA polymerase sigma-70 factor (sigma-E family)
MVAATFDAFLGEALPGLARYAHVLTGDRHAAEDLLQDTLLKAFRGWRRVRADGNPVAYVKTIMVRTHISRWRARRPAHPIGDEDGLPADRGGYDRVDDRDVLHRALSTLSPLQRAVLVLSFLDEQSDAEIAIAVQRRPATVRSLRARGLHALRAVLGDDAMADITGGGEEGASA